MATDKLLKQWLGQPGNFSTPEKLYWFAKINENNEVIKITAEDHLHHLAYAKDPSQFPSMKPADENTQIGDTIA